MEENSRGERWRETEKDRACERTRERGKKRGRKLALGQGSEGPRSAKERHHEEDGDKSGSQSRQSWLRAVLTCMNVDLTV